MRTVLCALFIVASACNVVNAIVTFPHYPRAVVKPCGDAPLEGPDDPCSVLIVRELGQARTWEAYLRGRVAAEVLRAFAVEVAIVLQLLLVLAFAPRVASTCASATNGRPV